MASPQLWAFVTFALLLSAVTVYSEDVTAQHRSSPTTCPMPCPVGETCSCTCQWKSRNRAAGTSTVGGNWLDIGTTCQVRRPWQTGRCRPGSRCTCACSPGDWYIGLSAVGYRQQHRYQLKAACLLTNKRRLFITAAIIIAIISF